MLVIYVPFYNADLSRKFLTGIKQISLRQQEAENQR